MYFSEMTLAAQTAYSELLEQTRTLEVVNALGGLKGSFQRLVRKGVPYWYVAYREPGGAVRMAYVGPDDARVRALIARYSDVRQDKPLVPAARAAIALGCAPIVPKHFRIIKRLAEYGFFRAGGTLIGCHAFLALGNMLGLRWRGTAEARDADFALAGRNISIALPAQFKLDTHDALESLEMGLLPISQFNGLAGAKYRSSSDQEPRVNFLTIQTRRNQPVVLQDLNATLASMKFTEYLLEQTTQACVFGNTGACVINLPSPERFAVHKLIEYGERPVGERTKFTKDLLQVASLLSYFAYTGQADVFNAAWRDAFGRGRGWSARARRGRAALIAIEPALSNPKLWS